MRAEVRCADCADASGWRAVDPAARYRVLAPRFLSRGGDGYTALSEEQLSRVEHGQCETLVLKQHSDDPMCVCCVVLLIFSFLTQMSWIQISWWSISGNGLQLKSAFRTEFVL